VKLLNNMANIMYVRQPYPRWDGEAILRVKSFLWNEPFLVLFWDDLIDASQSAAQQLVEAYKRKNSPVIATIPVSDAEVSSYGIIESNGGDGNAFVVDRFLEKPNADETSSRHGVVGKYILNSEIFSYLERACSNKLSWEIRLADAFELMRQEKDIYGVNIEWARYDTGSKIGFLKATVAYALKNKEVKNEFIDFIKTLNIH
jgi:UTP--glucose-1-phosphate uridylyltransferase